MKNHKLFRTLSTTLIVLIFLFSNCGLFEKDEESFAISDKTLYGKLSDKISGNGIENISVYLRQGREFQDFRIIDSTKTNSKGEYKLKFKYLETDVYNIGFYKNNFYTDGLYLVVDEDTDTLNRSFYPIAFVNFKIKNIEPSATTDELGFNINTSYYEYWKLPGKEVDTIINVRVPSIQQIQFVFGSKIGTKDSIFSRYFQAQPGEVLYEEINY